MKRYLFSALTVVLTAAAATPAVQASEAATNSLQTRRLENLDIRSKAVEDIQTERLESLDTRSKAIENIQAERLDHLDTQSKATKD